METPHVDEQTLSGGRPTAIVMSIEKSKEELESIIVHHVDLQGNNEETVVLFSQDGNEPSHIGLDYMDYAPVRDDFVYMVHAADNADANSHGDDFMDVVVGPRPVKQVRLIDSPNTEFNARMRLATTVEPREFLNPDRRISFQVPTILAPKARRTTEAIILGSGSHPDLIGQIGQQKTNLASFSSVLDGKAGVTHVFLDKKSAPSILLTEKLTHILGYDIREHAVGTLDDRAPGKLPGHRFYFLHTQCNQPLEKAIRQTPQLINWVFEFIKRTVSKLHSGGLLLGIEDSEHVISAFLIDPTHQTIELADWTQVRTKDFEQDSELEMFSIDGAIAMFMSTL
jgi:hypothetical protein